MKRITVRLDDDLHESLEVLADVHNESLQKLIHRTLSEAVESARSANNGELQARALERIERIRRQAGL